MDYLQPDNFFTMVPEVKAQWIADLRSGEIPQTQGKLHRVDGSMCCLGVLSKLAADEGVVEVVQQGNLFSYNGLLGGLSDQTCQWAGLVRNDRVTSMGILPFKERDDTQAYLDDFNDLGLTFDQIADLIECFY